MMRIFVIGLLIIEGIRSSNVCEDLQPCSSGDIRPEKLPETKEDLMKICRPAIHHLHCEIRKVETCYENKPIGFKYAKRILATLREVCNEDTLLHAAVVDNLKCFSKVVNEDKIQCEESEPEYIQQFIEALDEEGVVTLNNKEYDGLKLHQCITLMNMFACQSLIIEKECGNVAMETFVEILQKVRPSLSTVCNDSYHLLPDVIRHRKIAERKERELNIFESFRKRK